MSLSHIIREEHGIQCMPCSFRIISEMLLEIHTIEKCDVLKSIIRSQIQSTLVISKSKGPSKILRDIRTSTYQTCSIEEKTI